MVDRNRQFEPRESPELDHPEFERELHEALQPHSAPPGFAARLMRQIPPDVAADTQPSANSAPGPRRARILAFPALLRMAAVASVLIVVLAGTFTWQYQQRRIAGERARHQVMTALQITHATLQQVAQNVSSIQNGKEFQP